MKGGFLGRFLVSDDCWEWVGSVSSNGYGKFNGQYAHRLSYQKFVGPIPEGLQLDHLCRNRRCVRPDHLEAVTQQENIRRGEGGRRMRETITCPMGHPYEGANLLVSTRGDGTRMRLCRACMNESRRIRRNGACITCGKGLLRRSAREGVCPGCYLIYGMRTA